MEVLFFTDPGSLPARSEQSEADTAQLQEIYLSTARGMGEVTAGTDDQLLAFATSVCDTLDENGGDSAYVAAVAYAASIEAPIDGAADSDAGTLGTIVVRSICPEYHAAAS